MRRLTEERERKRRTQEGEAGEQAHLEGVLKVPVLLQESGIVQDDLRRGHAQVQDPLVRRTTRVKLRGRE